MVLKSRNEAANNQIQAMDKTETTSRAPTTTETNSTSTQNSSSNTRNWSNSYTQNMDDASLAALQALIAQLMGGGTPELKQKVAEQNQLRDLITQMLPQYSKAAAYADSGTVMEGLLRKAMEANMPAIARSVQGAGTSASSMQGLLSQKLATESSQAVASAGLDASKDYAGITTNLLGILNDKTKSQGSVTEALIQALNIAKGATQTQKQRGGSSTTGTTTTNTQGTSTQSGGDTTVNTSIRPGEDDTSYQPQYYSSGQSASQPANSGDSYRNIVKTGYKDEYGNQVYY